MTRASDLANILKQPFTNTLGTSNYRAGVNTGDSIASGGNYNVVVGDEAGTALTTGDHNTAIGYAALDAEDTGTASVAIGNYALTTQNRDGNNYNTAVGYVAGSNITTGIQNTLMGGLSGDAMTTAVDNVAVGYLSMSALTDADYNVAVGKGALSDDTQGSKSTAVGYQALSTQNFTSATDSHNTAVGYNAGSLVTTGVQSVYIGSLAGDANTTGSQNTAVGYGALGSDTTGSRATAVGRNALTTQNLTSELNSYNTAFGWSAGEAITTGFRNTLIGANAGDAITTGDKNTILGRYNGNENNLDIRTSSNRIVLSDGDGTVRLHINNNGYATFSNNRSEGVRLDATSSHIFHTSNSSIVAALESTSSSPFGIFIDFSTAQPDNNTNYFIKCEDSTDSPRFFVYSSGDVVNHDNDYGAISDVKLKEQITNASSQWDDIKALQIRKFKMKEDVSVKGDSDSLWRLGVIAQEVETAGMNGLVRDNPDMIENEDGEIVESDTTTKSVKYSILYMKAVKALQEAMARIEALEKNMAKNSDINDLQKRVTALEGS